MEKKIIVQDIKNSFEGASFLNINEIAKYLGMSRNTVPKLLEGIDFIQFGHQRKYLAVDLAARLIEIRRM